MFCGLLEKYLLSETLSREMDEEEAISPETRVALREFALWLEEEMQMKETKKKQAVRVETTFSGIYLTCPRCDNQTFLAERPTAGTQWKCQHCSAVWICCGK